ncbi:hypothetical protein OHA21_45340 [Actinoplanes sp. NBC_00393]|uniref:hypothetical protein n=1 Tax=Actinoplanes sp. NBC_00393 TaxID=2975953 RepID=UPI002E214A0D
MRFFSNEAKDNADERDPDDRTDAGQTDTVQSDPVSVPQQRAGSPWQHGPADSTDRPPAHEPAPQPTAFGASTVGGAVAASAAAGPYDDTSRATDRTTDAASGVADDRTAPLNSDDTRDETRDRTSDAVDDVDRTVPLGSRAAGDDIAAVPVGHTDTPAAAAVRTDRTDSAASRKDDDAAVDLALEDKGTFDDPKLAEDARHETDKDHDGTPDREEIAEAWAEDDKPAETTPAETTPAVIAPADTKPAATAGPAPFFPTADTQSLRERWRDVQLRFVDDPKGATGEAAGLVDEAVDKLTKALRDQRGSLAKGTDDTEALRVELRSYRDILDRLLGL